MLKFRAIDKGVAMKLYKMKFSVFSDEENSSLNITLGSIHSEPMNKSKINNRNHRNEIYTH